MSRPLTDAEHLERLEKRRLHVFTFRSDKATRKRLLSLTSRDVSFNDLIKRAVEEFLKRNGQ